MVPSFSWQTWYAKLTYPVRSVFCRLVVEDIFDTGLTLKYVMEDLLRQKPNSIEACSLLNKKIPNKAEVTVKYIGFDIEDRFVVGYGLDFAEKYREVPYIACLD